MHSLTRRSHGLAWVGVSRLWGEDDDDDDDDDDVFFPSV